MAALQRLASAPQRAAGSRGIATATAAAAAAAGRGGEAGGGSPRMGSGVVTGSVEAQGTPGVLEVSRGTPGVSRGTPEVPRGTPEVPRGRAFFSTEAAGGSASAGAGAEGTEAAAPQRSKLLVLGGSGFVGAAVCEAAVSLGAPQVASLSRSGLSPALQRSGKPWVPKVEWLKGDVLRPEQWADVLPSTFAVVSCVGAFGSKEYMLKINGDANVGAIKLAAEAGVERFVYISAADFGLIGKIIPAGYYEGKHATEAALGQYFPQGGVALQPGMIHGTRLVGNSQIPLSLVGAPLQTVFSALPWLQKVPVLGPAMIPPVPVACVGRAAVRAAMGKLEAGSVQKLSVWDILREGK